jgi:hypothetical protein
MKKAILVLAVALVAAVLVPLAVASSSPQHSTGSVDWNYQGNVTGHVNFDANAKTGGSLDYQDSTGGWIHGVVQDYKQIDDHTAVFTGTITDGSQNYTIPGHFYAKVVDGGSSGKQGDQIAVLANAGPQNVNDPVYAGPMADVTGGNLVVH